MNANIRGAKTERREITTLRPNENTMMEARAELVERYRKGWPIDPPVVTRSGVIIDGHHRVASAWAAGRKDIIILIVPDKGNESFARQARQVTWSWEPKPQPRVSTAIDLKTANPKAILAAERQAAELLTSVNLETKQTVRELIARSYREGINSRNTARMIRDVVGLNDRQATALFNYRAGLVEDGLSESRVEALTERYGNKLLRQRAETIAQTEIHRASAEGQHELWREAVREGRLGADTKRIWIANAGACPWCETMELLNADGVPIDGQFVTPDGDSIDGPEDSHVGCRCSTGLEFE